MLFSRLKQWSLFLKTFPPNRLPAFFFSLPPLWIALDFHFFFVVVVLAWVVVELRVLLGL